MRPSDAQIREAIQFAAERLLEGPVVGDDGERLDWCDSHGYTLAVLASEDADEGAPLMSLLEECHIFSADDLRSLLRMTAASAQVSALSWVLQECAAEQQLRPSGRPPSQLEVMDEATGVPYWAWGHRTWAPPTAPPTLPPAEEAS